VKPRRSKALEKELADSSTLVRQWKRWHREQLEEALAGMHRDVLERLMAQLENLRSARELVQSVAAEDWGAVDDDTRAIALHEIGTAITKLRLSLGLEPLDDGLPDEPENAFRLIEQIVAP
jgi:hypothetical protein